jgi:glycosyltransferase involved in cell wall biosynthesis
LKLLFVTAHLPSPPTTGAARRMHGLMRELAREHEVSIVSLIEPLEDPNDSKSAAAEYCKQVTTVPSVRQARLGPKKRLLQLESLLSTHSYEHSAFYEPAMLDAVDTAVVRGEFDLVQFECAQMGVYATGGRTRDLPLCLDEHNIEYDIVRRTAGAEADVGPLRRAYSALNWRKLHVEERRAWRSFDGVVLTSARDEHMLRSDEPSVLTAVVPNGVDVDTFTPDGAVGPDPCTVLFFGALHYYPNVDALNFFVREIWPLVKAQQPNARFRVLGRNPPPSIAARVERDIEVIGFVEDVKPHIARASVVIAPLRIGGGTRLKVLEAMSLGKAVVSTTLGAEGLDVTDGENILLADDAPSFARQTSLLLSDSGLVSRLGVAARNLVVELYSWRAASARLVSFYEELLEERARERTSSLSTIAKNRGSRSK